MPTFGVSPAFLVARSGTRFTVADACAALPAARALGFTAFQPEIYHADTLPDWSQGGARTLARVAQAEGLAASQFVAHFLLEAFGSAARLAAPAPTLAAARQVLDLVAAFPDCRVLTLPLAPFALGPTDPPFATPSWQREQHQRCADLVAALLDLIAPTGLRLALELLPGCLLANSDGFLRLHATLGAPAHLGVNLDTGHAAATRDPLALLPAKLAGHIFGTHLKDYRDDTARALPPGTGPLPWGAFLPALLASGYAGSLDLEIACPPDAVPATYTSGLRYLQTHFAAGP